MPVRQALSGNGTLAEKPIPTTEIAVQFCSIVLTVAIQREILSVLAASDTPTVAAATARVADGWSGRRRRLGHSPSSVHATAALVYSIGDELVDAHMS